jgi:RNA polymerase sigma factor (sigma-70 family)
MKVTIPTKEEDLLLLSAAQLGDIVSRNELITRHMPFILSFCKRYMSANYLPFVEFDDLVSICVLAMIHAIRKFDKEKTKGRFVTYAAFWLKAYLERYMNGYQMLRVPVSTIRLYQKREKPKQRMLDAIKYFIELRQSGNVETVIDKAMSPSEEAEYNEELMLIKDAIKHYKKELDNTHRELDRVSNERLLQSRILNSIRELLILRTEWNGVFAKGEDLSSIIKEIVETGKATPRGIPQ